MEIEDATIFGQLAVKAGLITQEQLREGLEEARELCAKQVPDLPLLQRILERKDYLTSFQSSKLLKGDTAGYFLGGYRLLYRISSGSFGRVFRADDPRTGRVVAIKVLRRRWSEDQQRIDLFIREGKVGLTLKHPNIVEVLAISQDPATRQYFIVMEFVEGGNLREILRGRKILSVVESLRILEDAASGLAYAYSRGITHRDIKLTNLLISSKGEAKLTDFGLAQMFAGMSANEDEHVDRTVDYAGLEKTTGVKSGDVRSDIYFLGCVFSEMVTGRAPLVVTRDRNLRMSRRRFEEVDPVRPGEIEAPPSVYQLVESMMALNPQRRFQTPSQLVDAVKAIRREVGSDQVQTSSQPGPRSLFIAESDERLQEVLREKFKELGFRVLTAKDPALALARFRQRPYQAIIVDIGSTGEDGLQVYEKVLQEAANKSIRCVGIAILSEEQAAWASRIPTGPRARTLTRPVGLKELRRSLEEMLDGQGNQNASTKRPDPNPAG
jgi:serine/threonine protein kinase